MAKKFIRVISDFNSESLSVFLKHELAADEFDFEVAPFQQVYQTLSSATSSWADIVWTAPERTLPSFKRALQLEQTSHEDVLAEVEDFANSIIKASENRYLFFAAWVLPPVSGYGMLDWKDGVGLHNLLAKCNLRFAEKISVSSNIFMLPSLFS